MDLECRIPAKCGSFTQLIRESRKPEDSLAERGEFELSGDFIQLSAATSRAKSPPTNVFRSSVAELQTEKDSMAEQSEFELPVPVSKLSDDSVVL